MYSRNNKRLELILGSVDKKFLYIDILLVCGHKCLYIHIYNVWYHSFDKARNLKNLKILGSKSKHFKHFELKSIYNSNLLLCFKILSINVMN